MNWKLWHLHSEILKGFYASDVYVAAANHIQAQNLAYAAFIKFLDQQLDEMGYFLEVSKWDDQGDYLWARQDLLHRFGQELQGLKAVEGNTAFNIHSG